MFEPHAYHRGSVWPFDSWLGWGGLRAAGRAEEAERVRTGVLAALDRLGRAPELYAVSLDGEVEPVALSNRVQAWTVGARWALENEWDGRPPRPSHARLARLTTSSWSPRPRLDGDLEAAVGACARPSRRGGRRASPTRTCEPRGSVWPIRSVVAAARPASTSVR